MKKLTYQVPDMHCPACVMRLEEIEDDLPGVRSIEGSYHRQTLVVEFDDAQTSDEEIRTSAHAKGYALIRIPD